jgi:hypothetical protein
MNLGGIIEVNMDRSYFILSQFKVLYILFYQLEPLVITSFKFTGV